MPRTIRPPRFGMELGSSSSRGRTDFGQAIADQILANVQQGFGNGPVVLELPVPAPDQGVDDVRPTVGSVLHYATDSSGWIAELSDEEGSSWLEPVVGWAVVVTWVAYAPEAEDSEPRPEGDESEFQSEIQPVLFSDQGVELMVFREGVSLDGLTRPGHIPDSR